MRWAQVLVLAAGCGASGSDGADLGSMGEESGTSGAESSDGQMNTTGEDATDTGTTTTGDTTDDGSEEESETTGGPATCDQPDFVDSNDAWAKARDKNDATYWYRVTRGKSEITPSCEYITTIVVTNDQVTDSWTEGFPSGDVDPDSCIPFGPYIAPDLTFDELYEVCCSEVLADDSPDYFSIFEVDAEEFMSFCGLREQGCADDCDEGPEGSPIDVVGLEFGAP